MDQNYYRIEGIWKGKSPTDWLSVLVYVFIDHQH
jgi:hypothetical protein